MYEKYFNDCKNPLDLSTRYNEIRKVFNLDRMMDNPFKSEVEEEFRVKMMSFTSEPQKSSDGAVQASYDVILAFLRRNNIPGEKIGKWLWVSGTAVNGQKETLKRLGFRFSESKQRWYWRADEDKSSNPNPLPLEVIRKKYGSQAVGITG
ncbi:MAG: hypothetical protein V2B15_03625 [Bacteroidota bacterium]